MAKRTDEEKKKISESLRAYNLKKKQDAEQAEKLRQSLQERIIAVSTYRDPLRYQFQNLTAPTIQNILDSVKASGLLWTFSDFCDYMMETDSHLRAVVEVRLKAISGNKIIIQPSESTEAAKLAADFIRREINKIPEFNKLIRQMNMAVMKGVSCHEILWTHPDESNVLSVKDIIAIPIKRLKIRLIPVDAMGSPVLTGTTTGYGEFEYTYWNYGDNNYPDGLDVFNMFPSSFIVHSPGDQEIIHFRGLLRSVAWPFFYKNFGIALWAGGAERYAFPSVYARVPEGTPAANRQNVASNLASLATDATAVFDETVQIDRIPVDAQGGSSVWGELVTYNNNEMTKLILGGNLAIDAGKNGSYALGEVQERVREDLIISDADSLATTLRYQLFYWMLENNKHLFGGVCPPIPLVSFDVTTKDYQPIDMLGVESGIIRKNELRQQYGLPPLTKEDGGDDFISPQAAAHITEAAPLQKNTQPDTEDGTALDITGVSNFNDATTYYQGQGKKKELTDDVLLTIKKEGSKYTVYSEGGKQMGSYDTKEEALDRLKAIEYYKNK